MLPILPLAVSEKRLIAHVNACVKTKKQHKDWGACPKPHFKLVIGDHFSSNDCQHWPLIQLPWWEMSHRKLINTHKTLVSQKPRDAEQEIVGPQQAVKAVRAENATPLVTNDAPATIPPESLDVDSFDFTHRNDSVLFCFSKGAKRKNESVAMAEAYRKNTNVPSLKLTTTIQH